VEVGVAAPASTTAAAVSPLNVDPGSKVLRKIRLLRSSGADAATLFGSTVGYSAAARIFPVPTSTTMICPCSAP
jgi:L-cystine uptake protein TcyP (sodium:dicarboxylate symporter family)